MHQLLLVLLSLSCSTVFSVPLQGSGTYLSFCFLSIWLCDQLRWLSSHFTRFSSFCWLSPCLVVWLRLGDLFVSQNPRGVFVSQSPRQILKRSSDLSSPVVGLHSVGRLTFGWFCWVWLGTGEFLQSQVPSPQAFTPFEGGVYCLVPEAPRKGECHQGRRYFWPCRTRVGFGPVTGPSLKTALCHIRALVGRMINNQILNCGYTICSYGQISIFCTIPSGSPCLLIHV